MLDMTETIAPRSDQMNADDLMSGPRTFTIRDVRVSSAEQPVDVVLAEFPEGRPFRPSKSMRRVMVIAWGHDASTYIGKRLTLYRDPTIKFGGQDVGGVRISHMSDLPNDKQMVLALTVTRGKRAPYIVKPLPASTPTARPVTPDLLAELGAMFGRKGIPDEARLAGVNRITRGNATALETITEDQARAVLAALAQRPDVTPAPVEESLPIEDPPGDDEEWPEVAQIGGGS